MMKDWNQNWKAGRRKSPFLVDFVFFSIVIETPAKTCKHSCCFSVGGRPKPGLQFQKMNNKNMCIMKNVDLERARELYLKKTFKLKFSHR